VKMHNCKATRKQLIELVLDMTRSDQNGPLLAELELCPSCREEFASLRRVLRVADQAMSAARPAESFWSGYHTRLQQSLERELSPHPYSLASRPHTDAGALVRLRSLLQRLATASVSVPVPVAAVLIVLFGLSIGFAAHSRRQSIAEPHSGTLSVVTKTVEVPVIHERTITRVVYRERSPGPSRRKTSQPDRTGPNAVFARRNVPTQGTPISLVGFKPTNEVKLTIIKGSYRDEK